MQPNSPDQFTEKAWEAIVLEGMGGMPQFLIHDGQLSDRDLRRSILSDRIHQRF